MASNTIKAQVAASPRDLNPSGFEFVAGTSALALGATYTVTNPVSVVMNYSGGTLTVTLPDASEFPNRHIYFSNLSGGAINSASSNVNPQNGGATGTAIVGATAGKWAHLFAIPPYWTVIGSN
jgi:hypothetical protein